MVRLNMPDPHEDSGHDSGRWPPWRPYNRLPSSLCADMTAELTTDVLKTIVDLIRYGASRFNAAGLTFGHSYDNALDEATQLTLHALHMPHDLSPVYGQARVTSEEKSDVLALFTRRI